MPEPSPNRQIVGLKRVCELTSLSRTAIWRKSRNLEDAFPIALDLDCDRIGWYLDEISDWVDARQRVTVAA